MNTLERLKELAGKATPGPWEVNLDGAEEWWYTDTILGRGGPLASCTAGNAALIVTAINALPDLMDVVEAAREYKTSRKALGHVDTPSEIRLYVALAKLTEDAHED